jgi:hypothetical protein
MPAGSRQQQKLKGLATGSFATAGMLTTVLSFQRLDVLQFLGRWKITQNIVNMTKN